MTAILPKGLNWELSPETTLPRATLGELTFHCVAENVKQLFIWMSPSCLGGRDNSCGWVVSTRQIG